MHKINIKKQAVYLRKNGKTYGEIQGILGVKISKSTLSYWLTGLILSESQKQKLRLNMIKKSEKGRHAALLANKLKRINYLKSIAERIKHLAKFFKNKDVAKIALALLYLGEGSKARRGSLSIGNSNPDIIRLFLNLLRFVYNIDERKLRCTVQCRADQNTKRLEIFWSNITKIPLKQFYKSRIDPRTIGKKSVKIDYKGVCRIEYFSADLFIELMKAGELLCKTGL